MEQRAPEHPHVPGPSLWPVGFALGIVALLVGVVVNWWIVVAGGVIAVIFGFHLVGICLEVFKVRVGAWSYPQTGHAAIGGVPLYSGFMYAAVGSYVCQAWRRFDLRITGYRPWLTAGVAGFIYANFFSEHVVVDLRLPLAVLLLAVTWRTDVRFTVGRRRYSMPLALSFVLIGFCSL